MNYPTLPRLLVVLFCFVGAIAWLDQHAASAQSPEIKGWKLVWQDEFNDSKIDPRKWSPCLRGPSNWNDTMTSDSKVFGIGNGRLHLKALVNDDLTTDPSPFLTGGVTSQGKYSFTYGKIVIRARFKSAQGAWPALWLLGEKDGWPANGEIDLMEHLNFDDSVYQTVHSKYTHDGGKTPPKSSQTAISRDQFNTYGVQWDESKLIFTVNDAKTLEYPRVPEKGDAQWPFKQPFYIIMSMQVGGNWVGPAAAKDYPAGMEIDWVRVYEHVSSADH